MAANCICEQMVEVFDWLCKLEHVKCLWCVFSTVMKCKEVIASIVEGNPDDCNGRSDQSYGHDKHPD